MVVMSGSVQDWKAALEPLGVSVLEQALERVAALEEALACPECGARGTAPCVVKGTAQARSLHRERVFVP